MALALLRPMRALGNILRKILHRLFISAQLTFYSNPTKKKSLNGSFYNIINEEMLAVKHG